MPLLPSDQTVQKINEIFNENRLDFFDIRPIGEAAEAEADDSQKRFFEALRMAFAPAMQANSADKPFAPIATFSDGSRSVSIEDLSDDDLSLLQILADCEFPSIALARVNDILWVRKKNHLCARKAVDNYLRLAELAFSPSEWVVGFNYIKRANTIACQLGNADIVSEHIDSALSRLDGSDPLFFSLSLVELQVANKRGDFASYLVYVDRILSHALEPVDTTFKV